MAAVAGKSRPKPMPNYGRTERARVLRKQADPLPLRELVKRAGFVYGPHRRPVVVLDDGSTWG